MSIDRCMMGEWKWLISDASDMSDLNTTDRDFLSPPSGHVQIRLGARSAQIIGYGSNAAQSDASDLYANFSLYAGRGRKGPAFCVCKGRVTCGDMQALYTPANHVATGIASARYFDEFDITGSDFWPSTIIANNEADGLASLNFALRGCDWLYLVIEETADQVEDACLFYATYDAEPDEVAT